MFELGYYKLRRVSEIFAEAICQAVLQLGLLIEAAVNDTETDVNPISVLISLVASAFVMCLWGTIIFIEGNANGMNFVEYVTVIFQGSFQFVPFLPAIERGTKSGIRINWVWFRIDQDGVGHVGRSLSAPTCKLKLVKVSTYTLKKMNRFGCKFFGTVLAKGVKHDVEIIVSRTEDEINKLFTNFDIDDSYSFDFEEFARVAAVMKASLDEPLALEVLADLYYDLADRHERHVWLLDLLLKIRGSKQRIPILDFDSPLYYSLQNNNLRLASFLMASKYADDHPEEFEFSVTEAVCRNNIKAAMCMCEDVGVPIVVELISGHDLLRMDQSDENPDGLSDPYVVASCLGVEKRTPQIFQTINPIWNTRLLLILPFEQVKRLLDGKAVATSSDNVNDEAMRSGGSIAHVRGSAANQTGTSPLVTIKKQASMFGTTGSNSKNLIIYMKVNDYDENSEDDFMGSVKYKIDMSGNKANMHETPIDVRLKHLTESDAGSIRFKVYLNVFQAYETYGLKYIDSTEHAFKDADNTVNLLRDLV